MTDETHSSPDSHDTTHARRAEHGFTLLELIIVAVIIMVISAVAVPTLFSTKKNATKNERVEAAKNLVAAVEAYKLDHAGRPPLMNSNDWPNEPGKGYSVGPRNRMPGLVLEPKKERYLRSALPESITSGRVPFGPNAAGGNYIQYIVDVNSNQYAFVVAVDGELCYLGAQLPTIRAKECG